MTQQHNLVLTRAQLDVIRDRVQRGADPQALSHWLARVTDINDDVRAQVQAAAQDFQSGCGHRWYDAAAHAQVRRAAHESTASSSTVHRREGN
jgi:hypothetical protein